MTITEPVAAPEEAEQPDASAPSQTRQLVVPVDLRTGSVGEPVLTRTDDGWWLKSLLSDNRGLFRNWEENAKLAIVDLKSSEVLGSLLCDECRGAEVFFLFEPLERIARDEQTIYAFRRSCARERVELLAWNWTTLETRVVWSAELPNAGQREPRSQGQFSWTGKGLVSLDFTRGGGPDGNQLCVQIDTVGSDAEPVSRFCCAGSPGSVSAAAFADGGRTMFCTSYRTKTVLRAWDIFAGEELSIDDPGTDGFQPQGSPIISHARKWLFLECYKANTPDDVDTTVSVIGVLDMRSRKWVGWLLYPKDVVPGMPHRLLANPTGEYLVAVVRERSPQPGRIIGPRVKVLIWDMSVLNEPAVEPVRAEEGAETIR